MRPSLQAFLHRLKAFIFQESLFGALESPSAGANAAGSLLISGWVFSPGQRIATISVAVASFQSRPATYGFERADVSRVFRGLAEAGRCGFRANVPLDPAVSGAVTVTVVATDDVGRSRTFRRTIHVAAPPRTQTRSAQERIRAAALAAADASFAEGPLPSVSIVIPVYGCADHTDACLDRLQATLPAGAAAEVIVVDDASPDHTAALLARWRETEPRLRIVTNDRNVGFGESCNRGARAAEHEILIFLNNDTLPQEGWLPPLLAPFRDAQVGAVGARLLYPDGALQEAGGVIFSDASGWNFGKGSPDPDDPLFSYVREVDYCSAAALATPRRHFLELGGFDARFAPAYYEDTDYCFALRKRGLKTLYQPASVIVHVEGATSGTDETRGVKQAQAANRVVFQKKWRDELAGQPAPPSRVDRAALHVHAARRSDARRALVCAPTLPEWDRESGSRRVFDLITFLRELGWSVSFVAESAPERSPYISALQQAGVAVYAGMPPELPALGRFDIALLHFWWTAEQYIPSIRRASPTTRIVVDSVDLHFLRRARAPNNDAADSDQKRRELDAYAAADAILTVSEPERETLGSLANRRRVFVVPDAESFAPSPIGFDDRRGLLFLGNFRHDPNVDALEHLMGAILPLLPASLLDRHPVSIVGTDLTESVIARCAARRDGVRLIGWVPDVQPLIESARVMVAPLRYGAGTKRKLIQAAMIGTPAVSTTIGVEGLPLRDNVHVLVADQADAFADAVIRLADDRLLWEQLAAAGREAIRPAHDRDVVRRQFSKVLETLVA